MISTKIKLIFATTDGNAVNKNLWRKQVLGKQMINEIYETFKVLFGVIAANRVTS